MTDDEIVDRDDTVHAFDPDDLNVKLGTTEEVFWTERLEACNKAIEHINKVLKFEVAVKGLCEDMIAKEQ